MDISNFLRSIPIFSKLDDAELQRFGELTREKNYPKGSVIVFEDDPGDSLFIVRDGRVKVVLIGEDGREVILGVLGVGEHFGELALIDDQPRSAHVIAMEGTNLLVLRRAQSASFPRDAARSRRSASRGCRHPLALV